MARGENGHWIERTAGFALVPHAGLYMRAEVKDLISRVVVGRGAFDYWERGLDLHFGKDMYESFVRYQSRLMWLPALSVVLIVWPKAAGEVSARREIPAAAG